MKSVAEKMRIKPEQTVLILNRPAAWIWPSPHPVSFQPEPGCLYDHVIVFVKAQEELRRSFPALKSLIGDAGSIWVAWPKGRRLGSRLTLDLVCKVVYPLGMVESVNLAVDAVWTALRFTWPKPGKVYASHHAELIRDPNRPQP